MEKDPYLEGRDEYFVDIDRMINEGLGGGQVTTDNGLIADTIELEREATPSSSSDESTIEQ